MKLLIWEHREKKKKLHYPEAFSLPDLAHKALRKSAMSWVLLPPLRFPFSPPASEITFWQNIAHCRLFPGPQLGHTLLDRLAIGPSQPSSKPSVHFFTSLCACSLIDIFMNRKIDFEI